MVERRSDLLSSRAVSSNGFSITWRSAACAQSLSTRHDKLCDWTGRAHSSDDEEASASNSVDEVGMAILTRSMLKSKIHRTSVRTHRPTIVLVDAQNQIKDPQLVEMAGPLRRDRS